MPPRYAYWTILAGGLPTAFRAAERDDLLPTFNRLRERHPDAELKYFARGRLWNSREDAEDARRAKPPAQARGRDWRPGGEHRDPRQKFTDERRAKNQARRQERWKRKHEPVTVTPVPKAGSPRPGPKHEGNRGPRPARQERQDQRERRPRQERPWRPAGPDTGPPSTQKRPPRQKGFSTSRPTSSSFGRSPVRPKRPQGRPPGGAPSSRPPAGRPSGRRRGGR